MVFDYQVLIVGGGPAGLSAAMTLGRIRRTALVCDDDRPRNAPSAHANNLPGHDGINPAKWRGLTKQNLEKYKTIQFFKGSVQDIKKVDSYFEAKLSSGKSVKIKKVILAYGVQDRLMPLDGFKQLWGKSIFHCPFCHGFEITDSKIGLIIKSEMGFHPLPLINSLSEDFMIFMDDDIKVPDDIRKKLNEKNIKIYESKIKSLKHSGENLEAVVLEDGQSISRDYLFYAAPMPFELKSDLGTKLGCERNEFGLYKANDMGETSVKGVFAAGDNMSFVHSVLLACASGTKASFTVIKELLEE